MPTLFTRTGGSREGSGFPRTRWSLVARVLQPDSRAGSRTRDDALTELVSSYWRPVYRTLRVRYRRRREEAEDLTQAYFLSLIEDRTLERFAADPKAGRFRGLLHSLLQSFVRDADRHARRQKRGGDRTHVPLDPTTIDAIEARIKREPEEDPFDHEWRSTVIDQALADLANEARSPLTQRRLQVFLAYEVEPAGEVRPTYAELARELKVKPHDVKNDLVATRRRFAELILDRIREETRTEEEARDELRSLFGGVPPQLSGQ